MIDEKTSVILDYFLISSLCDAFIAMKSTQLLDS